jgi:D-alanyl-D-alanine carboxypeptidase
MGAYLSNLGFGYKAIYFMTHKGPASLDWLTPDVAKEKGVTWSKLQPPRAIPIPQQPELHARLQPPPEVITAWSKLMPRPVTAPPERGNETVVSKRGSPFFLAPDPPEEVRLMPQPVTTSPEPVREQASKTTARHGWIIQVGAYPAEQAAKQRLSTVRSKTSKLLTGEAFIDTIEKGGMTFYRARFGGLDKDQAEAACEYLKKNDVECVSVPPVTFLSRLMVGIGLAD